MDIEVLQLDDGELFRCRVHTFIRRVVRLAEDRDTPGERENLPGC